MRAGFTAFGLILQLMALGLVFSGAARAYDCIPTGAEIPDNHIDEDCNAWLSTSHGYNIRAEHPRVLLTKEMLDATVARMYGPSATEPHKTWFSLIKARQDSSQDIDLASLALVYQATGEQQYLDALFSRLPTTGSPGPEEMYTYDILFDVIPDDRKLNLMARVNANNASFGYGTIDISNQNPPTVHWGYHSSGQIIAMLAYSAIFGHSNLTASPEYLSNPQTYQRFNMSNLIRIVTYQLGDQGFYRQMENRIAGDMQNNTALPGSYGGMYDNIGYDSSPTEDGGGVAVVAHYYMLTGIDRFTGFLHDQYRATFYQSLQYPHRYAYAAANGYCTKAGTELHAVANIWLPTQGASQPAADRVALTAWLYRDPRMQYYFEQGRNRVLCGGAYAGMFWDLIFYDPTIPVNPPGTNQLATYFSGPGLVSTRSDWSNNATFAVLTNGEHISRRYEDTNGFLLHRKTDIITVAGGRSRFQADNDKHHWYSTKSISKNIVRIVDPLESYDVNPDGTIAPLHSGTTLFPFSNFGGLLTETNAAYQDDYRTSPRITRPCSAYPLAELCEMGDVERFENTAAYAYALGDSTASYTRKIEYVEREFLHLRPDTLVIFDRVKSVDPSYRKIWSLHTVPKPYGQGAPTQTNLGMARFTNQQQISMPHPLTDTDIDILLPRQNRLTIRGGDTELANAPLSPSQPIAQAQVIEPDIPRWMELFVNGPDVLGAVTITGDASEGNGVTETVVFNGTIKTYVTGRGPFTMNTTGIRDAAMHWYADEWKGFTLRPRGGSNPDLVVLGNDENTLFLQGFNPSGVWLYDVLRITKNTTNHWKKITGITTNDMTVDNFRISIPQYFDTENAYGQVYSFSPRTVESGYPNPAIGQYSLEVEATFPALEDNFFHVFSLRDHVVAKPEVLLVEAPGVSGALISRSNLAVFSNTRTPITSFSLAVPTGTISVFIADLTPNAQYYASGNAGISLANSNNGGMALTSSAQGTLSFGITVAGSGWVPPTPTPTPSPSPSHSPSPAPSASPSPSPQACSPANSTQNCTVGGCNGTQACAGGFWSACTKLELCCGIDCNDANSCTTDSCFGGVCSHSGSCPTGGSPGGSYGGSSGGSVQATPSRQANATPTIAISSTPTPVSFVEVPQTNEEIENALLELPPDNPESIEARELVVQAQDLEKQGKYEQAKAMWAKAKEKVAGLLVKARQNKASFNYWIAGLAALALVGGAMYYSSTLRAKKPPNDSENEQMPPNTIRLPGITATASDEHTPFGDISIRPEGSANDTL